PCMHFMTPDRRVSRFDADRLPAPLHLARSFWRAHYLTLGEKLRIAWGLVRLQQGPGDADPPFLDWLHRHGQTPRHVERFWGLVLTSALNETPERIGLKYARKVFMDGFLRHRRGFEVELPGVPLGQLYGDEMRGWLDRRQVRLQLQCGARRLHVVGDHVERLELRQGNVLRADWYVAAVPHDRLLDLLPEESVDAHEYFRNLRRLETSPITSVH